MKRIIKLLNIFLILFLLTSCIKNKPNNINNELTEEEKKENEELEELLDQYTTLLSQKNQLEKELQELKNNYETIQIEIETLNTKLNQIKEEYLKEINLLNTIEKFIIQASVIITDYNIDFNWDNLIDGEGGLGSGFIIKKTDNTYYILTNNHVVYEPDNTDYKETKVYDYKNREYAAKILFGSAKYDMAVISIETTNFLTIMDLAKENPEINETVIAIGTPKGQINSVGVGKVNTYKTNSYYDNSSQVTYPLIYHTAYMNKGNSGGMLINTNLKVVGINTFGTLHDYDNYISVSSPILKIREFLSNNNFDI